MRRSRRKEQASDQGELASVVHRNIRALLEVRRQFEKKRRAGARLADAITAFVGSTAFVWLSVLVFGAWFVINLGLIPGIKPFDPYPFVMLAMVTSVEAIFLSTFVLISQNRMAELAEKRADLDLQINLLAEHEITRLIELTDAIAEHLGVVQGRKGDLTELKKDVAPEKVLQELEKVAGSEPPPDQH